MAAYTQRMAYGSPVGGLIGADILSRFNDRPFSARLHIFKRLDVASQVFGDVRAVIVASAPGQTGEGLLGLEFLKTARIWLSYSTAMLFLQKSRL